MHARTWPCDWGPAFACSLYVRCMCICDRICVLRGSSGWAWCSAVFHARLLWVRLCMEVCCDYPMLINAVKITWT